uniref:Uncharacterized protein n=1 Tax=Arundo donax TaxID=35708 RepID=A0A0A9C8J5_ARUDO
MAADSWMLEKCGGHYCTGHALPWSPNANDKVYSGRRVWCFHSPRRIPQMT